jgi:hypothetical protein
MRARGQIGDDFFYQIEEELDWREMADARGRNDDEAMTVTAGGFRCPDEGPGPRSDQKLRSRFTLTTNARVAVSGNPGESVFR